MSRVAVACSFVLGLGGAACSAGLTDLSGGGEPGRANEVATNGDVPGAGSDDTNADDDAVLPDVKLDDPNNAGSPSVPMAPAAGCELVTFTPTTAQSIGAGQAWNGASGALADDGTNASAPLSTDNRESAVLVFGGFTGPAIPAKAVIKGLIVDVDRSSGGTCIMAKNVSASIAGATRIRPDATDPWQGVRFYGGTDDTWGAAIAPADLGASFTVAIQTRLVGTGDQCKARDARIDTLRVRVYSCVN